MAETTWWSEHKTADNAISNVPLAGGAYKLFKDGYSIAGDASKGDAEAAGKDVTSIVSDATGFASDAVSVAVDPLNFLISKGLGFLESILTPLKDALELVTGDPDKLSECAQKFDAAAKSLGDLANRFEQTALRGAQSWQGGAAPVAGKNIGETKQSIESTAVVAGHIASLLQISSMLMKAAYDIVNGIIADVIEYLVVTWVAAQAAAPFTFGGSEAAAMGASVAEVGAGAAQAGEKVEQAGGIISKIMNVVKKLQEILKNSKFMMKDAKEGETLLQEGGAGGKALTKLETAAGKVDRQGGSVLQEDGSRLVSRNQAWAQNVKDGLGDKVLDSAKNRALGEFGVPTSKPSDSQDELDQLKSTMSAVGAGTGLANKAYDWGDRTAKAIEYETDPGGYSEYRDETSGQ